MSKILFSIILFGIIGCKINGQNKKKLDYKKAEEFYNLALEKDPNYLNTLVNFANLRKKIWLHRVYQTQNWYQKSFELV